MSSEPSKEIANFADVAMFQAEPIDVQAGPQVHLLWMTPDPLGAIAAACKMYKGEVVRDLSTVTDAERLEYLQQITKTKLKAPFEFVKFHFLIEGVTRSFTHQLVRQRTAVYAQESLRFAVKEDMPVGLPPSLTGTDDAGHQKEGESPFQTREEDMRVVWNAAVGNAEHAYNRLIALGMPAEDARGLLPHNILTRVHYSTDLRALLDHAGNRLCTQAQFEWRIVFSQIVEAIRNTGGATVNNANGRTRVYFADRLTDLFAPVCYQTGKCEFKANFDRHCSIRSRVDIFERENVPSSRWADQEFDSIHPAEWLLNPGAARKKG